jgi:hypothetical protein
MSPVTIRLVNAVLLGMQDVNSLSEADRAEVTRELVRRGWAMQQDAEGFRESEPVITYQPADDEPQCLNNPAFTQYPTDLTLLKACARCKVQRQCEEIVRPLNSSFDGICAGAIYSNGRRVAK